MPTMKATKAYTYARRRLRPGDRFEATAADARLLAAVGRAVEAPPQPVQAPAQPRAIAARRQATPRVAEPAEPASSSSTALAEDPPPQPDLLEQEFARLGTYQRRDLTAEKP